MFTKSNNYLKIINDDYIHVYLYFGNIELTKLLKLLYVKKLFTIYMFKKLQYFFNNINNN